MDTRGAVILLTPDEAEQLEAMTRQLLSRLHGDIQKGMEDEDDYDPPGYL